MCYDIHYLHLKRIRKIKWLVQGHTASGRAGIPTQTCPIQKPVHGFYYTNYTYNFPLAPKSVNKLLWEVEDKAKQKLLFVIHAWWSVQNFEALISICLLPGAEWGEGKGLPGFLTV